MTLRELRTRVQRVDGVVTAEQADTVISAVLQTLRDRLTPTEADDLWAQLPNSWKELWDADDWWTKISARLMGINKLDRDAFIQHVHDRVGTDVDAETAVRVVFHAIKEQVSAGEANDVAGQLPDDLRTMWRAA